MRASYPKRAIKCKVFVCITWKQIFHIHIFRSWIQTESFIVAKQECCRCGCICSCIIFLTGDRGSYLIFVRRFVYANTPTGTCVGRWSSSGLTTFLFEKDCRIANRRNRVLSKKFFFFIFLEKTLFEHLAASIYFPSSTFFPLILSLMAERLNQTAALFGIKLASWDDHTRSLLSLWQLRARAACGGSRWDRNPELSWDESQAWPVSKASCSSLSPCQDTSVLLSVLPPVLLSLRKRYEIHI